MNDVSVVVEADIVAVTPWEEYDYWSEWELEVRSVLLTTEAYRWGGASHETPQVRRGDQVVAAFPGKGYGDALVGRTYFLAMAARGPFEEMDDSVRGYPASPFSTMLVFDDQWSPVAVRSADHWGGSDAAIRGYQEILELYDGSPRDRALALVTDAIRSDLPEVGITVDGQEVAPLQKPESQDGEWTPGGLGEWRRANGWEMGPDSAEAATQHFVKEWEANPAAERQLPVVEVDEQFGALQKLVGEVVFRDVTVVTTDRFVEEYPWMGCGSRRWV
ncbi:MAG: hypothetical protein GEU79_07840 [Acidimicrobiia bacterium]|nr:hypothetical protein [Acidimicrobiia bacterium]